MKQMALKRESMELEARVHVMEARVIREALDWATHLALTPGLTSIDGLQEFGRWLQKGDTDELQEIRLQASEHEHGEAMTKIVEQSIASIQAKDRTIS
jgi:hypothetical protein